MAKKASKATDKTRSGFFQLLWRGVVFIWQHPVIITVVILVLTGFFLRIVVERTFTDIFNCNYLFSNVLNLNRQIAALFNLDTNFFKSDISSTPFFCTGYAWSISVPDGFSCDLSGCNISWRDIPILNFSGLNQYINPPLESLRKVIVWSMVAVSALLSFLFTIIISRLRSIIKLLLLNKEEWRNFMFGLRTWAFLFLLLCGGFYYWVNIR